MQEDEDENMEEGARIAQELLGEEKVHLYPKIFQLVMADAAFTDGKCHQSCFIIGVNYIFSAHAHQTVNVLTLFHLLSNLMHRSHIDLVRATIKTSLLKNKLIFRTIQWSV